MIILTKEVFVECTRVQFMHITSFTPAVAVGHTAETIYQLILNVDLPANPNNNPGYDNGVQLCIQTTSKEEAYKTFKEISQQIVESGTVPELNNQMFEELLKEK